MSSGHAVLMEDLPTGGFTAVEFVSVVGGFARFGDLSATGCKEEQRAEEHDECVGKFFSHHRRQYFSG